MTGSGALSGFLVVSLEQAVAAPLASYRLAEAGARVIKIERPEGDFARGYDRAVRGESSYFTWLNRGKESIVLNLAAAADKAVLEAMQAERFIRRGVEIDADRVMDYLRPILEPLAEPEFTFTRDWMREQAQRIGDPRNEAARVGRMLNLPPEYLLLPRVTLGSIGVLCQLGARAIRRLSKGRRCHHRLFRRVPFSHLKPQLVGQRFDLAHK